MVKDDKDQSLVISNPEIEEANGVKSLNKEDTDTVQLLEEPVSDGVIETRRPINFRMTKKKKKFRKGFTQRRGPFYNRGIGNNNNNKNNDAPQLEWYEEFLDLENKQPELEQYFRVYNFDKEPCAKESHNKRKQNCKDNPNCLFGFGENKEIPLSINIHADPSQLVKSDKSIPSGLKNLGATCYMNTLLQTLFWNASFRQGVYSWHSENVTDPGFQLQLLFAQLQYGIRTYVDPSEFVKSIMLKPNVQQDPQEFFKLFISLLEDKYAASNNPEVRSVIQNQFQGKCKYVTTCKGCNSSKHFETSFYELELSVKGHSTIEECLNEYVKEEQITEENQYFCDVCNSKKDATRSIVLSQLPEVLNFQLLRYVYDKQFTKKKKLRSKISFPFTIDVSPFIAKDSDNMNIDNSNNIYELSAVLVHKGISASGGHYIAHIRDDVNQKWWTFDDDSVKSLNEKNWAVETIDGEKEESPASSNEKPNNQKQDSKSPASNTSSNSSNRVNSCNAYMLVYTRKNRKNGDPQAHKTILDKVFEDAQSFQASMNEFAATKKIEQQRIDDFKKTYTKLSTIFSPKDPEEEFFVVPTSWFSEWVKTGGKVGSIDTTELLCSHNKLNPLCVSKMKRISKAAREVFSSYGDAKGPLLSSLDMDNFFCIDCIKTISQERNKQKNDVALKDIMIAKINDYENKASDEAYWVSKKWLTEWRKKAQINEEELGTDMTGDLLCDHDQLNTNAKNRRAVSEEIWNYLHSIYPSAIPVPCKDFVPCIICEQMEQDEENLISSRQQQRAALKKEFEDLFFAQSLPKLTKIQDTKSPNNSSGAIDYYESTYYVLPKDWQMKWRENLEDCSKEDFIDKIDNSVLMCVHERLKYDPLLQLQSNGKQDNSLSKSYDVFRFIPEKTWIKLVDRYTGGPEIKCTISKQTEYQVTIEPTICPECFTKEQEAIQQKLLQYESANITVEIIPEEKENKSEDDFQTVSRKKKKGISNNSAPTSARGNRYALRSTNSTAPKKEKIEGVKSSETIHNLKLMIYQVTDIPPFQQSLSYNGVVLERDDFTLAQYNIFPDAIISLEKSKENTQLLEEVPANYYEEGFKGTGLYGGVTTQNTQNTSESKMEQEILTKACPVCTLLNPLSATQCSVCENKL